MVVLPVQIVTGHLQPADVSFAVKGEAENLQRTLPSLYLNRFVLEKHRPLKNTMGNIILLIFRHLQTLMRALYEEAIEAPEIVALSIGTRPDCLSPEVLSLLKELNKRKPVFIEMGLQTAHDHTAAFLNRAYPTETFTAACHALSNAGIRVTAHIILGLPGETADMEIETIRYLNSLPINGIKISMLYVLKNTILAEYYKQHPFHILTMEEYIDHLIGCLSWLRKDIVVERITGDGPKDLLITPKWIGHKRLVLNTIHKEMKQRNFMQGGSLCQKNL